VRAVPRPLLAGVVACFFLSGATGLVYEVLWIRMLGMSSATRSSPSPRC
jgi:hypothetical protein